MEVRIRWDGKNILSYMGLYIRLFDQYVLEVSTEFDPLVDADKLLRVWRERNPLDHLDFNTSDWHDFCRFSGGLYRYNSVEGCIEYVYVH